MINLSSFDNISDYDAEINDKIQEMLNESTKLHRKAFLLTNKIISRHN